MCSMGSAVIIFQSPRAIIAVSSNGWPAHRETYWVATMRDVVEWIAEKNNRSAMPRNEKQDCAGAESKGCKQEK